MNDVYILEFFTGQSNKLAYSTLEKALDGLQGYLMGVEMEERPVVTCIQEFPTLWRVEFEKDAPMEEVWITKLEVNPGNPFNMVNEITRL